MKSSIFVLCGALALVFAVGLLAGCGGKDDGRGRDGMPLLRAKLKNTAGPVSATARVQATAAGQPSQTHEVGPVEPGQEASSTPTGTKEGDGVTVEVTQGESTKTGSGEWPGDWIKAVHIEIGQQATTATIKFHSGRPEETITLSD